jgi:hypothetical protein
MLLEAGYTAGAYILARLFLGRVLSTIAALALTLSVSAQPPISPDFDG